MEPDIRLAALQAENKALRLQVAELKAQLEAARPSAEQSGPLSPELYQALFQQLPVPIVVFHPEGPALAINQSNQTLIGASEDAIVGQHSITADPQALEMGYLANFERARQGETVTMPPTAYDTAKAQLEGRSDDRVIWSQTTYFPVRDAAGAIRAVGELNMDVTEQMRAQLKERRLITAVKRREQHFRALFTSAALALALVDRKGRILAANGALEALVGYTAEELRGSTSAVFTHADDRFIDQTAFVSVIAGRTSSYQCEKRFVHKDGHQVEVHLTVAALRDTQGNIEMILGMAEDITARRNAEEALRANETLLRAILDQLPSFIFVKSTDGRYQLISRNFALYQGYLPEQMHGKNDAELFDAGRAERYAAFDTRVLESRQPVNWEETIVLDGQERTIYSTRFPLLDASGRCYAICGIATDITGRKREETERLDLERRLLETQKLESLGLMAGGIAHDFNNLLVTIMGNASVALEELEPGAPSWGYLQHIDLAARRAADLTRQMLAYAGKGRLVIEPVNIAPLVTEAAQLLQSSIAKHVSIRMALADDLPAVDGDATQLQQVVMNLIANAAEAIQGADGLVSIEASAHWLNGEDLARSNGTPELTPGRYVVLQVADTGVGMDQATQAKIFEPFFSTKFTGRGLGLAAVQGIVRGHKGAIRVRSAPGGGSTFTVTLPAAVGALPQPEPPAAPAPWQGIGTVLIIDDEADIRHVAARMLARLGFQTLQADGGLSGIELFRAHADTITLVLLDMTMPQLSGVEVVRQLRQIQPDARVVLMSGYNQPDATSRFEGEELAGFLGKPFMLDDLRRVMRQALGIA